MGAIMAPMSFPLKGSRGEDSVLSQMALDCEQVLLAAGVPKLTVNRAVLELMNRLRRNFGGWAIYIPKGRVTREDRAAEVHARYKAGETVAELAMSYGFVPVYITHLIAMEERRLQQIRSKADASARRQKVEKCHG